MKVAYPLLTLLSSIIISSATQVAAQSYRFSDAHLHFVNFHQQNQPIEHLLQAMDEANVEHAMISGLPVIKKWDDIEPKQPKYTFSDDANVYWYSLTDQIVARAVMALPDSQRARLHPFICGFNPTDKNAIRHVQRMLQWYPGLWAGIGEVITRHDDLTALTYGETARANHPALMKIYRLAAEHDLPVSLHSNITSKSAKEPLYLGELEDALAQNPNTRFIWAHAGTSKTLNLRNKPEFLEKEIHRLLSSYPNLWIDLSWTVMDEHINEQEEISPKWLTLINRFPDRFMLGSDITGSAKNLGKKMQSFEPLLQQLSSDVAKRLASDNFLSILPKGRHR